jgi:predicted dehydrogenase
MNQEEKSSANKDADSSEKNNNVLGRRNFLKALAAIPFLGAFLIALFEKKRYDDTLRETILDEFKLSADEPLPPVITNHKALNKLRIGIIGFGFRGEQLARAAGFAHPDWIEEKRIAAEQNKRDTNLKEFYEQDDLNIEITGICDVFDIRAERGLTVSNNKNCKRYYHYHDLLESKDIDAVIIATPDHWHAQQSIDAAQAGKHLFVEKCMTRTIPETYEMREVISKSNVVFQLGHTGRQSVTYLKAKEVIEKNILGKITLIEMTTNRNNPFAAWIWPIHEKANEKTIDWMQFLGPAPYHPFSPERFFQWRRWWDYGTGMSGDLLTHEFDAVNMIMNLGIPKSATSSGGIYYFKDGRTVPDVFCVTFEYPDRDLTLLYNGTLANGKPRRKLFMGHDAYMEVGGGLTVSVDAQSTRYKEKLEAGIIDADLPLLAYNPGQRTLDAVTSATEKYFADRGLSYTYRAGKRVNTTTLHIAEWLNAIRNEGKISCDIEQGFQEAITAHMATQSYLEGRKVIWDEVKQRVI